MGKVRTKRRKFHKENPTGLPSVKDFDLEEAETVTNEDREIALQRVLEEIQSANIEEKLSGLQTMESMCCDTLLAVQIASNRIAKILGPSLLDPNASVRACSASALRTVVEHGDEKAHEILMIDDVMSPICASLKQYLDWQPKDDKRKGDNDQAFLQTILLLSTLCEYNEQAILHCNRENIVSLLIKFLDITVYGIEIVTVVTKYLSCLLDDNLAAVKQLSSYEDTVLQLLTFESNDKNNADAICLKTAVSGLLLHLASYTENTSIICTIVNVLSSTLSIDHNFLLCDLVSILPHEKNALSSSAKKRVRNDTSILGAQQHALAILANLSVYKDEDSESEFDFDDLDCETEDTNDERMEETPPNASLPVEVVEIFKSCAIIDKVWDKTKAVDTDTIEILEQNTDGKEIINEMRLLNARAYYCLTNLISSSELDVLGGTNNVYRMWIDIGTFVFKNADPTDKNLVESAAAALSAAIKKLAQPNIKVFDRLTLNDIEFMIDGERRYPNPDVRLHLMRILGSLACILRFKDNIPPDHYEVIKRVSMFLLDNSMSEPLVWIMAEAMDAIMDIFSDDDSEQILRIEQEIQLVEKLKSLVPIFKKRLKQQKKDLGDHFATISTVNGNITRFIKYKESRM
ncbi:HEAT repeat-containing protein 3 [Ceratina calcarata]|uniref:HEAT repeat-containing protein 3 n=1 Tax=Ceratina calcarata TaxID=156304 RepID=A0AAJ7N9R8_9HYME|nr:HEAT repeat-containing protein 3 [Ceratina calcarata]